MGGPLYKKKILFLRLPLPVANMAAESNCAAIEEINMATRPTYSTNTVLSISYNMSVKSCPEVQNLRMANNLLIDKKILIVEAKIRRVDFAVLKINFNKTRTNFQ